LPVVGLFEPEGSDDFTRAMNAERGLGVALVRTVAGKSSVCLSQLALKEAVKLSLKVWIISNNAEISALQHATWPRHD